MDSLRYFVIDCHVDGFRFDLAVGARARVPRGRPALGVLRHHPPGPGALAGEADRRAVGRRARAATRSATSRCSGRSGTASTATRCATSGAAQARVGDFALPLHRLGRPLRAATAAGRSRRSTSSPRTTASRSPTSSRTTRSTTRRTSRTTATAPTTTAAGTAASRARPTTRRSTRCASASSATSSRRCFLSQGVPMLLGGDEIGRTQRGNNNAYCQDNEISWFDWDLDERQRAAARVHAAADRAAARAPGLPARDVPRRRRRDGHGPARHRGGSGPTAGKMTRRDWERRRRAALGVFLNGEELATRDAAGRAASIDDSFLRALQRAPRAGRRSRCRRAASARAGQLELSTAEPDARARRALARAAARSRSRRARCVLLPRGMSAELRATYRLQLGPELDFADARALVPYLRELGVSHLYLSPVLQARPRLDARLRRGRPAPRLGRARRRGGAARALRGARGLGHRARRRPEPHGDRRREPVLARPGAARAVLRRRPRDRAPPALLRHRRARRRARRGPRGVRDDARATCSTSCAEGLVDGLRIDHPDGLADPRGYLERLRRRAASSTSGSRRSSSRASGCATGRSRARPATSSSNDVAGALRRPGRRGRRSTELAGRAAAFDEVGRRGEARAGADDLPARGRAAAAAARRARPRARARVAAGLPHLRRAVERPRRGAPTARRSRRCPSELRRVLLLEERGHDEFVTRFQQTTGAGDGEGRRGHGVLPLRPPARAERGRRRPGPLRALASRSSTARTRSAPTRFPRDAARRDDARHEAQRRRARAHRRARGHGRASGASASGAGAS